MSYIDVLQGTPTWLAFVALNTTDDLPRTGIVYTKVDVFYKKSSQTTFNVKAITSPEFVENGYGVYEVLFSALELNTLGSFIYLIQGNAGLSAPPMKQYVGMADIVTSAAYTPGTITLSTNIITGNLVDLVGDPLVGESVSARVLSAPTIMGTTPNIGGIGTDVVSAQTDSAGFFALELLQGSVVDIIIPVINYRRTLTIPANLTDKLFEIP